MLAGGGMSAPAMPHIVHAAGMQEMHCNRGRRGADIAMFSTEWNDLLAESHSPQENGEPVPECDQLPASENRSDRWASGPLAAPPRCHTATDQTGESHGAGRGFGDGRGGNGEYR